MGPVDFLLRSGRLRHVIQLELPSKTRSTSGAVKMAPWMPFATVRAMIDPGGGSERFSAEQYNPESLIEITIRYLPGVTTEMRIVFGTRTFDIINVNNIEERNRVLALQCREGRSKQDV